MKTFDRKIATYSHPSLTTFFNSTLNIDLNVTKKVTCNITKINDWFKRLGRSIYVTLKASIYAVYEVTENVTCNITQVAHLAIFDFIFQTSRNGRNENDKNKNN